MSRLDVMPKLSFCRTDFNYKMIYSSLHVLCTICEEQAGDQGLGWAFILCIKLAKPLT
jgi:hypothetical protein